MELSSIYSPPPNMPLWHKLHINAFLIFSPSSNFCFFCIISQNRLFVKWCIACGDMMFFASFKMMLLHSVPQWCDVCPMCRQAYIIRAANIIRRSQHHLPKANIIQKKNICLGRQMFFFCWWGMVDSDHRSQWQQIYSLPPLAAREIPHILGHLLVSDC